MKFIKNLFKHNNNLFLVVILFIALFALMQNINEPFYGYHEWNGVFYSNIARNYLRYGFLKTKLGEVTNYGIVNPQNFQYHTQHPVFYPIFLAIFFKFFGISEWSARLMSIFFSLGSLIIFYLILRLIFHLKNCFWLILWPIATPLFLYYGRMPVYEPVVNFFILATVYCYWLWREKGYIKYFWLINLNLFLCQMIEWPGFYLSIFLALHNFLFPRYRQERFKGFWWLGLTFFSFCLIVFHQYLLTGQLAGRLWQIVNYRLGLAGNQQPFSSLQFIRLELARTRSFFTTLPLLLTLFWLFSYARKIVKKKIVNSVEHFILFFLIFGFTHILIFPNVAWYHDYMLYYCLFPIFLAVTKVIKPILKLPDLLKISLVFTGFLLIFWEKRQFLLALKQMKPYINCVAFGKAINSGKMPAVLKLTNQTDYQQCPPFTKFYADKEVDFIYKSDE